MRRRRYYVGLSIILILVFTFTIINSRHAVLGVEKGYAQAGDNGQWNALISNNVNQDQSTSLVVDGRNMKARYSDTMFLQNSPEYGLQWMVAVDSLTGVLECYVGHYSPDTILIQRAEKRLVIDTKNGEMNRNGEAISGYRAICRDGKWFICTDLLADVFGYEAKWNPTQDELDFSKTENTDMRIYPAAYDYRAEGRASEPKSQGRSAACWAYAATTCMETGILPEKKIALDVDHMIRNNSYKLEPDNGGRNMISLAYLLAWQGPRECKENIFADHDTDVVHLQEAHFLPGKDFNSIKEHVFLYGGVQSSIFMDSAGMYSDYYNREYNSYCYIGTEKINHDIVIIGWDDNYPKENFSNVPEANGAFICMNSWGDTFGEDGCFYISYYDTNIGTYNTAYVGIEANDNYDFIYQTDLCGWIGQMGYNDETAYFANVYRTQTNEKVDAVGFYALTENTNYEVYIQTGEIDYGKLKLDNMVASGSVEYSGYYTIELDKPVIMNANTEYAVIMKITSPGTNMPIAIEFVSDQISSSANVDITDGYGLISSKGIFWSNVESAQHSNVCLKAYTSAY